MNLAFSLCLYFCFVLSGLATGWDTNVWGNVTTNGVTEPLGTNIHFRYYIDASTNRVGVKNTMLQQAAFAMNERISVVTVGTAITTTSVFRLNRDTLVEIKRQVTNIVSRFIHTNWIADGWVNLQTNDTDHIWVDCADQDTDTNTQSEVTFSSLDDIRLTTDIMINEIGLPTNYFTSTPWRKLTDPATSNGWHFIDDVLNFMLFPDLTESFDRNGEQNRRRERYALSTNSWSEAKSTNESNYAVAAASDLPPMRWTGGRAQYDTVSFDGCVWYSDAESTYQYPKITGLSTNLVPDITYYVYVQSAPYRQHLNPAGNLHYAGEVGTETNFFDSQGSAYTNGVGYYLSHTDNNVTGSTHISSTAFGNTTTNFPTWCNEPISSDASTDVLDADSDSGRGTPIAMEKAIGYVVPSFHALIDYRNTNGFSYYAD